MKHNDHEGKTSRLTPAEVKEWQATHPERTWAVTANRELSFRDINRFLHDHPPSAVLRTGYRIFLLKSGNDRDKFVEKFHKNEAKAYAS